MPPELPRTPASTLVDLLHQVIQANYEQAARHGAGDGSNYELVADVVAQAVCAGWVGQQRRIGVAELADAIGASLLHSENGLDIGSPARRAIKLVRQQIRSTGLMHRPK